ncbi:MAG: N-acetylneuraminate synthase [Hyphomicrobiaceae bacterium]|nr:N-acetylneuraminate synthase [Hyphomicrobiaceae bacterium]
MTPLQRLNAVLAGSADAGCFVIAEAGVNHNGNPDLAHRLIDIAADAGADSVKFQTFNADALASPKAEKAAYQKVQTGGEQSQKEMLRALELPHACYDGLRRHCRERSVMFLSTPFDEASAQFLVDLGVDAIKIGSGEVTNIPFLRMLAGTGLPLLLSTGMSDLAECHRAVSEVRAAGAAGLALFHCVSNYPARAEQANLRAMATLRAALQVPVGYSDHVSGTTVSLASVAMGATLLEKHFTVDRSLPGPDHAASLEPSELKSLIAAVREISTALGHGRKDPHPDELDTARVARRSLHLARDVAEGAVIGRDDLICIRPGTGLSPALLDAVLGQRATRALAAGDMLAFGDWR